MNQAIFFSYASQDADAVRRICDALRAAGLEVWFDQSELRGGDAWDASIRKQIKECALFVPVISANTQTREEGYFRLEWKLAVDRSHLMVDNKAFFFPIVIDDTPEATAKVPDKFRERQWSRLNNEIAISAFAAQIAKVISRDGDLAKNALKAPPMLVIESAAAGAAKLPNMPSIAVLAFANRSSNADDEYFSDGLADELLSVLSKIKGLRVAAHTSAFSFKGKSATIAEIGHALNVASVLEGSVRKSGNRARIAVQLVEVADGYHLWSETYDRTLDDIFAVQDDIAQAVVAALRETLLGAAGDADTTRKVENEITLASAGRSDNSEAYGLYLKARFHVDRMSPADISDAVLYLEAALKLDPNFALGYAALAHALTQGAIYGALPIVETVTRARREVQRALSLQPDLVEAHLALGEIQMYQDWDWEGADASFARARSQAPANAEALRLTGNLMTIRGRHKESIAYFEHAISLDPLNSSAYFYLVLPLDALGESAAAENAARQAVTLSPDGIAHHYFLCLVLVTQRRFVEAIAVAQADATNWSRESGLALAYLAAGRIADSEPHLHEIIQKYGDIAGMQVAMSYAATGEIEETFKWLEHAYVTRDAGIVFMLAWSHHFKAVHSDPRWMALLKKMRFAG